MVTSTKIIQQTLSQMEGQNKVPDHKIMTGHGPKVKAEIVAGSHVLGTTMLHLYIRISKTGTLQSLFTLPQR